MIQLPLFVCSRPSIFRAAVLLGAFLGVSPVIAVPLTSSALAAKPAAVVLPPVHVMIDPGHGGSDSGAVSGGVRESELVLSIAQQLEQRLKLSPDFRVSLTRTNDQRVQLHERVRKAEIAGADVFISLHANSNTDARVSGMEIYFQNHLPPDEETLLLAALENQKELMKDAVKGRSAGLSKKNDVAMIVEDLRRSSRVRSSRRLSLELTKNWEFKEKSGPLMTRPIRQAPFHVVTRISIPSVLMEIGFLTNKNDREELKRPEIQAKIVENLYAGLVEFKRHRDGHRTGK